MKFQSSSTFIDSKPNPRDLIRLVDNLINDPEKRFINATSVTLRTYKILPDEAYRTMQKVEIQFVAYHYNRDTECSTTVWYKWNGFRAIVGDSGSFAGPVEIKREDVGKSEMPYLKD